MGGKKPVGEHPSRGSYFRRLTKDTSATRHHSHHHHHPSSSSVSLTSASLGGDGTTSGTTGSSSSDLLAHSTSTFTDHQLWEQEMRSSDVPLYQDFSLFSAFSSDRFGILQSNNSEDIDIQRIKEDHDLFKIELPVRQTRVREDVEETGNILISEEHYNSLLEQNDRLSESVQQLNDIVRNLAASISNLQYEHCVVLQQLQFMCVYSQQVSPPFMPPPYVKTSKRDISSGQEKEDSSQPFFSEEVKKLNERLSTVEGRHKTVQSKISQLDKLYGPTSAAWGRNIKAIIDSNCSNLSPHVCSESSNISSSDTIDTVPGTDQANENNDKQIDDSDRINSESQKTSSATENFTIGLSDGEA